MKGRPGWPWAALVVAGTNLVALGSWAWNRQGEPESVVELTAQQAQVWRGEPGQSSVELQLRFLRGWPERAPASWADSTRLLQVGFTPRQFAVEGEGPPDPRRRPAWILLALELPPELAADTLPRPIYRELLPVAFGTDPEVLYRESGNRSRHLVVRGVIALRTGPPPQSDTARTWHADLEIITPETLHVPKSLVPVLDALAPPGSVTEEPRYRIRVATGRMYLPRVVGVLPGGG
jgi:hypothetical protein